MNTRWKVALFAGLSVAIAGLLTHVLAAARFARVVLTPPGEKVYDLSILGLGYQSGALTSVTLPLNEDTVLPGEYSLVSQGLRGALQLGEVVTVEASAVVRKVRAQIGEPVRVGDRVRFNGWMGLTPTDVGLPWTALLIDGRLGRVPAWFVPSSAPSEKKRWAIHVHGRSATRAETLRGVGITRELGFDNLICSYRNDPEAITAETGRYALGSDEWEDVDASLEYAVRQGAEEIVLYGWSMGGAIALQVLRRSSYRHRIRALVLDSPVLDWVEVLDFHGRLSHLPGATIRLGFWMLKQGVIRSGTARRLPLESLRAETVLRGSEVPVLVLHSDDDGYVPGKAAEELADSSQQVTLTRFSIARHCKLWNFDQERYTSTVAGWLQSVMRSAN